MITAFIGVGSNVEREKHIRAACHELSLIASNLKMSPVYTCESFGFSGNDFYNMVVCLETSLSLVELSAALKEIEVKWGRDIDAAKFQNRTIDLDILLFGNEISQKKPLVPREDIFKYSFVTQPLYDLAPDLVIPNDERTLGQILAMIPSPVALRRIDFQF
ncbi:2-amino-4-hydroxy-6-hydroxymethyldihydropteridine diphosphokinase [Vibrio barjaei]|jgi:2-amino-4-hydroxy-6-hydroxymethyldihydropteridine diphosphokinase|uniref:2-amino-4-hydroxy-6-hydroxymethyldihydropteridine diphosphokinase n=1 Tax=Vibrio barjaei TaxID=1676683 RepID=A0ABW7IL88_9VIBR|nr:2-amino-4-hydroxy-6-hydroxymethyldihydropteridine diphosphokinase [Vibrio barjaei]MCG9785776.1 2-amino-4-hydroxy-6-hydroxymethyldihydropteridine diphosphokinase [Vibrio mediterranei]MCY9869670.1 2-amino-4-hydroxy-6-hydroxymethyldihydropteridine diphosphokinase [Vibrio barjaei]OIN28024.1 2-amino-4-hydroxy-6-hydroxymethyldihydropteridine diphosphokinase [Vibrio barjaei]